MTTDDDEAEDGAAKVRPRLPFFPRLKVVDILPPDIETSDAAAYQPWHGTIWLRRRGMKWWQMAWLFWHELGHHAIEVVCGSPRVHDVYDALDELIEAPLSRVLDMPWRRGDWPPADEVPDPRDPSTILSSPTAGICCSWPGGADKDDGSPDKC